MTANADNHRKKVETVRAWLTGFEEVQTAAGIGAVSSPGRGFFRAVIDEEAGTIEYSYTYDGVANIVGTFGSSAGGHGVAMLRLDRVADALAAGAPLTAGGVAVNLVKPAWARFAFPGEAKAAE